MPTKGAFQESKGHKESDLDTKDLYNCFPFICHFVSLSYLVPIFSI